VKNAMQFLKLTVVFPIVMLYSSGHCARDIEGQTASAGLLFFMQVISSGESYIRLAICQMLP